MTEFRVLPVRMGDAYLLKSPRGGYLVDGGALGCGLPELLADRRVRKLRAVVCSSATPGRLGGILELLEAGFPVREYWLPESLALLPEMARRFNGDWPGWVRLIAGESALPPTGNMTVQGSPSPSLAWLHGSAALLGLGLAACECWPEQADTPYDLGQFFGMALEKLAVRKAALWQENGGAVSQLFNVVGQGMLSGGDLKSLAFLCSRMLLDEVERLPESSECVRGATRGVALASMVSALLSGTGAKLRFFRSTGKMEDQLVPRHPLKSINGKEVLPPLQDETVVTPAMLVKQATRMGRVRDGLIFQYGNTGCSVLFCGNSHLGFLGTGEALTLDRATVVAAPGRGSCRHDRAYAHIISNDPDRDIWVRGFLPTSRKVSADYRGQTAKACLNNCATYTLREVLLRFENGHWRSEATECCAMG